MNKNNNAIYLNNESKLNLYYIQNTVRYLSSKYEVAYLHCTFLKNRNVLCAKEFMEGEDRSKIGKYSCNKY